MGALSMTPFLLQGRLGRRNRSCRNRFGSWLKLLPSPSWRSGLPDEGTTLPDDELLPDVEGRSHLPERAICLHGVIDQACSRGVEASEPLVQSMHLLEIPLV